jgi:hypothetical protein
VSPRQVWVLTHNDGDYYSTYDEYISVHASREEAMKEGSSLANTYAGTSIHRQAPGEWVQSTVADRFFRGNPEQVELHAGIATWYAFPEEIG